MGTRWSGAGQANGPGPTLACHLLNVVHRRLLGPAAQCAAAAAVVVGGAATLGPAAAAATRRAASLPLQPHRCELHPTLDSTGHYPAVPTTVLQHILAPLQRHVRLGLPPLKRCYQQELLHTAGATCADAAAAAALPSGPAAVTRCCCSRDCCGGCRLLEQGNVGIAIHCLWGAAAGERRRAVGWNEQGCGVQRKAASRWFLHALCANYCRAFQHPLAPVHVGRQARGHGAAAVAHPAGGGRRTPGCALRDLPLSMAATCRAYVPASTWQQPTACSPHKCPWLRDVCRHDICACGGQRRRRRAARAVHQRTHGHAPAQQLPGEEAAQVARGPGHQDGARVVGGHARWGSLRMDGVPASSSSAAAAVCSRRDRAARVPGGAAAATSHLAGFTHWGWRELGVGSS